MEAKEGRGEAMKERRGEGVQNTVTPCNFNRQEGYDGRCCCAGGKSRNLETKALDRQDCGERRTPRVLRDLIIPNFVIDIHKSTTTSIALAVVHIPQRLRGNWLYWSCGLVVFKNDPHSTMYGSGVLGQKHAGNDPLHKQRYAPVPVCTGH